ncbi:hypothetical protein JXA88_00960 [Candidatus Fermentibacteria bacterium]|nr:hypothetical protein [Candidatus Fermentibacteria bacterium]
MRAFEILFPVIAVLSVPLMAWLMLSSARREARSLGTHIEGHRRIGKLLAVSMFISLAYVVGWALIPRDVVPGNTLALLVALAGFHGLWWGMAMPLVRAQDSLLKAGRTPSAEGPRSASLRTRAVRDYLPKSILRFPLMIVSVGLAALAWRLLAVPIPPGGLALASVLTLLALGELVLYRWWLAAEVSAPQIIRGPDPARQEREWEALRKVRVRAVFAMHCLLPSILLVFAVLSLETARGSMAVTTLGLIGGIVGITVGLGGGMLGVVADLQRRRFGVRRTLS